MISKQQLLAGLAGAVVTVGLGAGAITFAATGTTPANIAASFTGKHMPGVGGTVTAVSGNTITVTGRDGKTYTIDAGSATITKDETVTVADIKVGDTVGAMGTVNGTSITATIIHDGKMPMGPGGHGMGMMGHGRPNDNDADDAATAPTAMPTTTQ